MCLSIFERKDRSVINALLGTEPSYELVFCSNTEGNSMTYKYDGFDSSDLDEDGLTEFYLYTKSYFASTNSHEFTLISKRDGKWVVISPNIKEMEKSISRISEKEVILGYSTEYNFADNFDSEKMYLDANVIKLNDLLEQGDHHEVLGISGHGGIFFDRNPFNKNFEICYIFSCRYEGTEDRGFVYIMQQFDDKEFFTDPNWNMGDPLFTEKVIDLREEENDFWGLKVDGKTYFGIPDLKPND